MARIERDISVTGGAVDGGWGDLSPSRFLVYLALEACPLIHNFKRLTAELKTVPP